VPLRRPHPQRHNREAPRTKRGTQRTLDRVNPACEGHGSPDFPNLALPCPVLSCAHIDIRSACASRSTLASASPKCCALVVKTATALASPTPPPTRARCLQGTGRQDGVARPPRDGEQPASRSCQTEVDLCIVAILTTLPASIPPQLVRPGQQPAVRLSPEA
jgi:hypothetical protein